MSSLGFRRDFYVFHIFLKFLFHFLYHICRPAYGTRLSLTRKDLTQFSIFNLKSCSSLLDNSTRLAKGRLVEGFYDEDFQGFKSVEAIEIPPTDT